ncbi:MAG: MarR family transcriptional regulator [Alphaproteobacteria bacterium]|nr:MarR family transcriptional regulator [Alphaproteobacteria bacterium]
MSTASKRLADALVLAAIRLTRQLRAADKHAKMTGPQASALAVIVYSGSIKISDLAAAEQVKGPTISQLVNELERAGLACREGDKNDGRVSLVRATAKGKNWLKEGQERRIAPLAARLDRLSENDRTALARSVKLIDTLSKPDDE